MRTRSSSVTADQLREHAVDGIGVDEGDLEPEEPLPRLGVDQLGALRCELAERGAEISDLEGHVVHAGPALGEELADRRVVAKRGEELEPALAAAQRRGLDALA